MAIIHLLANLFPPDSIKLGRLVANAKRPYQNFVDPLPPRPDATDYHCSHHQNFTETRKFTKTSKLGLSLGDIISFNFINHATGSATLAAANTTTHDLQNSDAWFTHACGEEETRRWLEKCIDSRRPVYLVVGFRTIYDAKLTSRLGRKRDLSRVRLKAPGPPIKPAAIEPQMNGMMESAREKELAFDASGEHVFAVLYRKVKFNWFSSKTIGNMTLEENTRWKSIWDWRGPNEDEDSEDDVLEAVLGEGSDIDISEEEEDQDSGWDDEVIGAKEEVEQISAVSCGVRDGRLEEKVNKAPNISTKNENEQSTYQTPSPIVVWGLAGVLLLLLCRLLYF